MDREKFVDYNIKLKNLLDKDINHKQKIMDCKDLKEVHVYCKANQLNGQQTGPFIELWLIKNCKMHKNKASECIGDCRDKFMKDNEIKASLGGKNNNKFNYVQLRVNHKVDYYIFTAYYIHHNNVDNLGELYIFKITKENIIPLIHKYGGYAHGTKKKHGDITISDLEDKNNSKEYDLRPIYGGPLWEELLKYRVNQSDL